LQFFAGAVAIAIAVVFVVAVILNAVKDLEELRAPPAARTFPPTHSALLLVLKLNAEHQSPKTRAGIHELKGRCQKLLSQRRRTCNC
jgi:hypothetical protein